ncbi:nitrile hydratase subunit alpha [Rhodoplanes sp. Z2-YC6860]|uniref:nitrile hydratase subunit alpha n=1 Tax=Rhodoplanes sp. Z2-YC6860 TaxID=674703 RepID=UPI00078CC227|nr:nitrile hydratase subunit alpha [Rhodoplanes sp. Z2-YC6860]AMN42661.1 nitrile hydratase subunit alpha [Rhodoplanes sp. Z2-YC6860]
MSGGHTHPHDHDHDKPGAHPLQPDDVSPASRYELMTLAMQELLIEKGVLTSEQIRRGLEVIDSWQPSRGADVVARAWLEPEFKQRLLKDGSAAVADFGVDMGVVKLTVVENTEHVHNVIVCTLCSCYPRGLLGLPPDWYRSKRYRARIVREPRKVLAEFGTEIPDGVTVRVHDSLADLRYLVLPRRPEGTQGWSREQLASIVNRDAMVGVGLPKVQA